MSFITYQGGDSEDWESINTWIFAYQIIQSIHVPHKTELFAALFSDSTIAKQFSVRKTKCAYYLINNKFTWRMEWLCTLRIFFLQSLKEFPLYAVSFDESYTNVLKQAQMDLFIRYWKSEKEKVHVCYLNSLFMRKSGAVDVLEHIILVFNVLKKQNFTSFPWWTKCHLVIFKILNEQRCDAELNPLIEKHRSWCWTQSIAKELILSVRNSSSGYKEALKQKRKLEKKTEKIKS